MTRPPGEGPAPAPDPDAHGAADPLVEEALSAIARLDVVPLILDVVCRATGVGFAAVARVTERRWVACAVRDQIGLGLAPGGELPIHTTFCDTVRATSRLVVIDDATTDPHYRDHPSPPLYGFRSYLSVPIRRPDGAWFGTLCALDRRPLAMSAPGTIGMLTLFADLIGHHLDQAERAAASEVALAAHREAAELREQFIAVLGHDLRNPLASVDAGVRLLAREAAALSPRGAQAVGLMRDSVRRMARLVDDLLDLARGRRSGGLAPAADAPPAPLAPTLEQVAAELRAAWPGREILAAIALDRPVPCDPSRIAQLASNLLGNALTHGAQQAPVRLDAWTEEAAFVLSVTNAGPPIPPGIRARLFQPFFRGAVQPSRQGLGLGLYIADEIARGHGGTIEVSSVPDRTCFTFRMPLRG